MAPGVRTVAVLLLAVCAAVTLYIVDDVVESNFAKTHPEKTYLIGDQKFKIPKRYVSVFWPSQHDIIVLWAMFPNLSPVPRACGKTDTCDKIVSFYLSTEPVAPVSKQWGGMFEDPATKEGPGPFGLIEYHNAKWTRFTDIYGKTLQTGEFYSVFCNRFPNSINNCTSYEQFSKSVSLRIEFRRSQLKDWEQIHTSILALISSFETE